ncbi:uncharacterized protein LOC130724140 isoform X2 [Lotus japonicus]|uniref:uncharacterized protein LOC130724140 isoform X2 n=1 Tax=Lotus japonicus TaxID=34305 RepID=UPI00258A7271|nr:uncharacterized protein LOC130724140 isoform X2 [Lotus japonicus]
MGNEMGNNITSDIKEEDNISEAEKKNLAEDAAELANGTSQDVGADNVKEENQTVPTSITKDVMENASNSSSEIRTELGKDTMQEDDHADDAEGEVQRIPTAEAEDVEEKAIWFASTNTTNMLENDPLEGESVNDEKQNIATSKAKDVMENASKASSEIRTELGKDTMQEDDLADDEKGKVQTIPTAEAEGDEEKATWFSSNNTTSMIETDPLEGETRAIDVNMQNQILSTAEAEDVPVEAKKLASEGATGDLENVTLQDESDADDVKEEIQMIPTAEASDVQEKAEIMLENVSLEGDADESDVNMQNQMHPPDEAEDDQEKTTGVASDCTKISLHSDLSKGDTHEKDFDEYQYHQEAEGKDDQGIASRLDYDEKISEPEDKLPQEDKQEGNVIICIANGTDVQGKTTISASDDKTGLNLRNPFGGAEMTEARQPEKSPSAGSVETKGENSERLSGSSLEGTEKCGKQEDSPLSKHLSVTYDDHLDEESSIKQDEEVTTVLTLNAVNMENSELQAESPSEHSDLHDSVKVLSEGSHHGTESLLKDNFPDANNFQQIKDDIPEKDMEFQEKMSCANKSDYRDGNEFGNGGLIDTSEKIFDSPSIGRGSKGNLLTKANYTTEGSLNSFPEPFVVDHPINSDQEENCKVLYEERKLSRSGSTRDNLQDNCKPDQCMKESLQENKSDMVNTNEMTTGSNEDCNGERHLELDSSVFLIATSDQVEEPEVTDYGLQCGDAYVNNSNKASNESSAAPEEKYSVVLEAETVVVITGPNIVDSRHERKENDKNKAEDTNEKPEASLANIKTFEEKEISEKINSDPVTTVLEESFSLQHSSSSLTGAELTTSAATMDMEMEPCSNNSVLVNGGYYETKDSVTRLSTESSPDDPNISCQMQKSPSFNLNLSEDSDQTPLLYQEESATNGSLLSQTSLNLSKSMPHTEYDQSMLHSEEMPVEEKIVTVERSYSKKYKAPFKGLLREEEKEEEAHLLLMPQPQDNHGWTKKEVSSTSPQGKEKRKPRSSFFSSFMCCSTVAN